jgi:hypothetical protein
MARIAGALLATDGRTSGEGPEDPAEFGSCLIVFAPFRPVGGDGRGGEPATPKHKPDSTFKTQHGPKMLRVSLSATAESSAHIQREPRA